MKPKAVCFDCWDTIIEYSEVVDNHTESIVDILTLPEGKTVADFEKTRRYVFDTYFQSGVRVFESRFEDLLYLALKLCGAKLSIDIHTHEGRDILEDKWLANYKPKIIDNVMTLLKYLKENDIKAAVFSNTVYSHRFTMKCILNALHFTEEQFKEYFEFLMVSSDTGAKKPNHLFFEGGLAQLGITNPQDAFYVGDSPVADVLGSASAKMKPCFFNWKGSKSEQIKQIKDLFIFTNYLELLELLKSGKEYNPKIPEKLSIKTEYDVY